MGIFKSHFFHFVFIKLEFWSHYQVLHIYKHK